MRAAYSIYEAKARLSEIIRTVKARRIVVITERGVPVAEVVPYRQRKTESLESRIERLTSTGTILPQDAPFDPAPAARLSRAVQRFLSRDRD